MYTPEEVNYYNPSIVLCCPAKPQKDIYQERLEWEQIMMRDHGADVEYLKTGGIFII